MADYQIKISAVDNATPIVNNAFKRTGDAASNVSSKIGNRFRDVFENVTQNATGSFGSIAGGLFKLPGAAGIAAAGVLAAFGTMIAAAKKYAEANAANDTASAQFLANLEGLKKGFGDVVNSVGSSVIPIFNSLAEAFGFAGTKADELDAKRKALFDGLKSQREQINAVIENLTLQRESQGAFKPVVDAANQLKQVEASRAQALEQIQATEKAIASAREEAYKNQGLAFLLDKKTREEFDKKLAAQNLSLTPLRAQLENLNAQVLAAEELLLKEKALFDQRNQKTQQQASIQRSTEIELQANDKVKNLILGQLEAKQRMAFLLPAIHSINLAIAGALMQQGSGMGQIVGMTERQLTLQEQIGVQINQQIASGLGAAIVAGENLGRVLDGILRQLASRALTNLIFKGLGAIFPGAGLAGGLLGGLFGRRASVPTGIPSIGISNSQRIAPTPTIRPSASPSPINMNIVINGVGMNEERLVRTINKYVKQGGRLLASQVTN